jgi:hypothetical protein
MTNTADTMRLPYWPHEQREKKMSTHTTMHITNGTPLAVVTKMFGGGEGQFMNLEFRNGGNSISLFIDKIEDLEKIELEVMAAIHDMREIMGK